MKELPLPRFYGFGSTIHNNNKYRFIVIEKFDKDLEAFLQTVSDSLLLGAVINIVRQIVSNTFYYIIIFNIINFNLFYLFLFLDWCLRVYTWMWICSLGYQMSKYIYW